MPKLPTKKAAPKEPVKKTTGGGLKEKLAAAAAAKKAAEKPVKKDVVTPVTPPKADIPPPKDLLTLVTSIESLMRTFVAHVLNRPMTNGAQPTPPSAPATASKSAAPAKAAAAKADDDDPQMPDLPGISVDEDGIVSINKDASPKWSVTDRLAVGEALGMDLSEYIKSPREMDRLLIEKITELEGGSVAAEPRATAKQGEKVRTMPVDLDYDGDGIPTTSPYVGDPPEDWFATHIPRSKWELTPKNIKLVKVADAFFTAVRKQDMWACDGINCFDCTLTKQSIEQVVLCHKEKQGENDDFEFEYPKGSDKLAPEKLVAFVTKRLA